MMNVKQPLITIPEVPLAALIPLPLFLVLVAIVPLAPDRVRHLWERLFPAVTAVLAATTILYYIVGRPAGAAAVGGALHEYVEFMLVMTALFVVAGGIHVRVKRGATPGVNVLFLAIGCVVANFIGTTGASMLLIRPWIQMNKVRASPLHVAFFIFLISNIGGALTPIGDPPLLLGYLHGIPFFWLIGHVMVQWLATVAALLLVFYFLDRRSFRRMPENLRGEVELEPESWRVTGTLNFALLAAIIVVILLPNRFFLREAGLAAIAAVSWWATPAAVHDGNKFTFGPIKEVAILFAGIFATMLPFLDYLAIHGGQFGLTDAREYYFATGALSSVLDNAPTYLNFLELARATAGASASQPMDAISGIHALLAQHPEFVVAISLGSVFFGAMTYLGNAPNWMVKAVAHEAGVHCPTFLGYIFRYSLPILLPILVLSAWLL